MILSAHWACRHSDIDIIKLLASTLENDKQTNPKSIRINHLINSRTVRECAQYKFNFLKLTILLFIKAGKKYFKILEINLL